MSHWAEVDDNNVVLRVLVGNDSDPNEGYDWLIDNLGGTWIKTSYNTKNNQHLNGGTPFRGNYAGAGFTYNEELDVFIPPKPFDSWIFEESISDWVAPVPKPEGDDWYWDEESASWLEF